MMLYVKRAVGLLVLVASFTAIAGSYDDFFRAVRSDDVGAIRELLRRGFDPNTRDPQSQTGLLLALREPSPRVARALIESPQTDVEARNNNDESPLMMAALKGHKEFVDQLIARDADVNKPGWAPLHYAATNGHLAIMRVLLEHHAFIDAQSPNGTTPLMMAAMYGTTEAVKLLLEEGADPLIKNQLGLSAADFAQRGNRPDAFALIAASIRAKRPQADGKW